MTDARFARDYRPVIDTMAKVDGDRAARMKAVVDALWDAFAGESDGRHYSWVGFYEHGSRNGGTDDEMLLLERRDKPACSPIGLFGLCARGWRERRAFAVHDIAVLGQDYIACDPKDLSEAVVPMFDADGSCWGVIDADSFEIGAFDASDLEGLRLVCEAAGLSEPGHAGEPVVLRAE